LSFGQTETIDDTQPDLSHRLKPARGDVRYPPPLFCLWPPFTLTLPNAHELSKIQLDLHAPIENPEGFSHQ
jgi:hypothetical protein